MITTISLTNFKCFEKKTSFIFSKINLLTGINGRGKSTLLQSLLLISQTFREKRTPIQLQINGEWVGLGTFDDIKNSTNKKSEISFHFTTDDLAQNDLEFIYCESNKNDRLANLTGLIIDQKDMFMELSDSDGDTTTSQKTLMPLEGVNTFSQFYRFHFVAADRLGPVEYVKKKDTTENTNVGIRGENLINVLAYNGTSLIDEKLRRGLNRSTLLDQTKEWLAYILDGADLTIKGVEEKTSSILTMLLNSKSGDYLYKPANVGFGYSYILPLIVTGLMAKKGDIVVVENPEAHLHPRAQSRLTEFFVTVASIGIQVFIESHSEHILNALRVLSIKEDISIGNKDMSIIYFEENYSSKKISIIEDGRLSDWPEGFFDQQDIDLSSIFKLSR